MIDIEKLGEPLIIAEVGINHNGNLHFAKKMIEIAYEAGASAVKFQTFKASEFCDPNASYTYKSQGKDVTENMLSMFERCEFTREQWVEIGEYCKEIGINFFSTPQNNSDLDLLLELGVNILKIGSDDLTNIPLIEKFVGTKLPVIISTGMSYEEEIDEAMKALDWPDNKKCAVLVCTSEYPTSPGNANLARFQTLSRKYPGLTLGFSDHTIGNIASIVAAAYGAKVFEKHFTLSHDLPGPDHWFSLDPSELQGWILSIKESYKAIGNGKLEPTASEKKMRQVARRSLITSKEIDMGEIFSESNIEIKRPGDGLSPKYLSEIIGKVASKKLKKGTYLTLDDIKNV